MIVSSLRIASVVGCLTFASVAQAQEATARDDLAALAGAFSLVSSGEFDRAEGLFEQVRKSAGNADLQLAAIEGGAFAMVASYLEDISKLGTSLSDSNDLELRLKKQKAENFVSIVAETYPDSQRLKYILAVLNEVEDIDADTYADLPNHAEYVRLQSPELFQTVEEPAASGTDATGSVEPSAVAAANTPSNLVKARSATRVRGGAGINFDQVASVAAGEVIEVAEVVEVASGPPWYRIEGDRGFIRSDLVEEPTAEEIAEYVAAQAAQTAALASPQALSTAACDGPSIGTFRVTGESPVFDDPLGSQVGTLPNGRILSSVTGRAGAYLVYKDEDDASRPVCRYVLDLGDKIFQIN